MKVATIERYVPALLAACATVSLLGGCDGDRRVATTGPDSQTGGGSTSSGSSESAEGNAEAGRGAGVAEQTDSGGAATSGIGSQPPGDAIGGAGEDASVGNPSESPMDAGRVAPPAVGGSGSGGSESVSRAGANADAACRQGASCVADGTCRARAADCFVDCTCQGDGTFDCELDCPSPESCSEGAECVPGEICGAELNGTCWVSCLCRSDGTFRCDEGCGITGPGDVLLCDAPPGRECNSASAGACGGGGSCFTSCSCDEDTQQIQCGLACQSESCPPAPPPAGFMCQAPSGVSWYPVGATCPYPDLGVTCTCEPFGTSDRVYWECE